MPCSAGPVGDAIAINMPMTVDAVIIYLGIVLAGCAVVSIADSFAAEEVATRLRISAAKAIFTQVSSMEAPVIPTTDAAHVIHGCKLGGGF